MTTTCAAGYEKQDLSRRGRHGRLDFTDGDAKVDIDSWEAQTNVVFGTVWCGVL